MSLTSISPIDGRYRTQSEDLAPYFSEWGLIRYRVRVEVEWLILMSERPEFPEVRALSSSERELLRGIVRGVDPEHAERVKQIERTTNHDVKAVEYYLGERLGGTSLAPLSGFLHFACTSEDINNLSYAMMLRDAVTEVWLPLAEDLLVQVGRLAAEHADLPMLARTHGQPATPTTLGKELAVFVRRWARQVAAIREQEYLGKFNGATGCYAAHRIAYPDAPWQEVSRTLVERLGLTWNPVTTQIESHDWMAELFHSLCRFNTILIDFNRDIWTYISMNYFRQKVVAGEVGSSVMPHKVNPINFENSEANAGVANALLGHLAGSLPISRLQRDLTDSSAQRNIGAALAHCVIAARAAGRGLDRLAVDEATIRGDLENAWMVLAEAVQTVLRKHGVPDAYERLKELTRGEAVTRESLREFIATLPIPDDDRRRLLELEPATYTGLAGEIARGHGVA